MEDLTLPTTNNKEVPARVATPEARKKASASKRSRDSLRAENKRSKENAKTIAARDDEINKKYRIQDAASLEALLQREIKYKQQVQTSTRGIGVAVAVTVSTLKSMKTPPQPDTVPVHALFRVGLGLLEEKMCKTYTDNLHSLADTFDIRKFEQDPSRFAAHMSIGRLPKVLSSYIDHLGSFSIDSNEFVPTGQPDRQDPRGNFIPSSGRVYLDNLRETVVYLANPESNAQIRRRFVDDNPIPGAQYNNNYVLINPNDIIPANYNTMGLRRDVTAVERFFSSIEKQSSKWLGPPPNLSSSEGSPAVLVTTWKVVKVETSHDPQQLYRYDGLVNLDDAFYYCNATLKPAEWAVGSVALYREPPNSNNERYPYWDGTLESHATHSVKINLADSLKVLNQMEWT